MKAEQAEGHGGEDQKTRHPERMEDVERDEQAGP